jgi:hypothetical protein
MEEEPKYKKANKNEKEYRYPNFSEDDSQTNYKQTRKYVEVITKEWKTVGYDEIMPKQSRINLDVFISSAVVVDKQVFKLWLKGFSGKSFLLYFVFTFYSFNSRSAAKDASQKRKASMSSDWWLTNDIIVNDTQDQFRMFSSLNSFCFMEIY